MKIDTIKKIVKKESDRGLSDRSLVGTCCIISSNLAITAKHVVNKKDNLFIEMNDAKYVKFTCICDEKYDFAILKLNEDVEITNYYKLNISNILEGDKWETFGFSERRELQGARIKGIVESPDTIEESIYDLELKITSNNQLQSYKGLSGSPVVIENTIKAILIEKPDGESLGGVKLEKCKDLIKSENIYFIQEYSEWINKLTSKIPSDETSFKVQRNNTYYKLKEFILQGSGIVVGDAGVGKSYMLRNIAKDLNQENISTLYVSIDDFISGNKDELQTELMLEDESLIEKIIKEKDRLNMEDKKIIIIFDSFDSARNEEVKQNFIKIIKDINKKLKDICNIIVSSRLYDARKSIKLQEIFVSNQIVCKDEIKCRHIKIDKLEKLEVKDAIQQICKGNIQYDMLSTNLQDILTIPFYLWIFENIYNEEFNLKDINTIDSELELLDLFWNQRVYGEYSDSVEYLINQIVENMITKKALSINRNEIFKPEIQDIWNYLYSNSIIKSCDLYKTKIAFYHNILFDYFVSRFILVTKIDCIVSFIEEDISKIIFLRPSFIYFFIKLWNEKRDLFWEITFNLTKSDKLPIISMFIPVNIIVTKVKSIEDLMLLIEKWKLDDCVYIEIIKRILQGISIFVDINVEVWIEFLHEISNTLKYGYIGLISSNIFKIIDEVSEDISLKKCNNIAINIYHYVSKYNLEHNDRWLRNIQSNILLPAICKTYYINKDRSKEVILDILDKNDEEGEYIDFIRQLVNHISYIYKVDYDLTEEIFINIYSIQVNNNEQTNINSSPILPLTSNRRQDYDMCKYLLHKNLEEYISEKTEEALKLAINTLNLLVKNENKIESYGVVNIEFRNRKINILEDNSYIWSNCYWSEYVKNYTDTIFNYFNNIIENEDDIENFLNIIADNGKVTFIWAQLFINASKFPEILKDKLLELFSCKELIICKDVIYELSEFIKSCCDLFSEEEINNIKKIADELEQINEDSKYSKYSKEYIDNCRSRILMAIKPRRTESIDRELNDRNRPLVSSTTYFNKISYKDKLHKYLGIDTNNFSNEFELLQLINDINGLEEDFNNNEKLELTTLVDELYELLQRNNYDLNLEKEMYAQFSKGLSKLIIYGDGEYTEEEYINYKEKFLYIINLDMFNESDENFTEINSVFSSTPKHDMAIILPLLASVNNDIDIISSIDILLNNNSLSLKCICISNLYRIYEHNCDYILCKFKEIIDINNSCLNEAISNSLRKLYINYEDDISELVMYSYSEKRYDFIYQSIDIILYLYFLRMLYF